MTGDTGDPPLDVEDAVGRHGLAPGLVAPLGGHAHVPGHQVGGAIRFCKKKIILAEFFLFLLPSSSVVSKKSPGESIRS